MNRFLFVTVCAALARAVRPASSVHLLDVIESKPHDQKWDGREDYPVFPKPFTINDERICTGYFHVGCIKDGQTDVRFHYKDNIPKEDQKDMTVQLCFGFCQNVTGSQFFGLERGRDCFCSPFYDNQHEGYGDCDQVCEGNHAETCGGMEFADMYEMHDCNNLPALQCMNPPPEIKNALTFKSKAYRGKNATDLTAISCQNMITKKGNTVQNSVCKVACEDGFYVKRSENDYLRCEEKGDRRTFSWGQWVGHTSCLPKNCGQPPDVEHARQPTNAVVYNQRVKSVRYTCQLGYSLNQKANGPTSFSIHCLPSGQFENTQDCLPVSCGQVPDKPFASVDKKDEGFYGQKAKYTCKKGYSMNKSPSGPKEYTKTCGASGEWSETGKCQPIECGPPASLEHATFVNKETDPEKSVDFPTVVQYHCNKGYSHNRRKVVKNKKSDNDVFEVSCMANGEFDVREDCLAVSCGFPPVVQHANREHKELRYLDSVTYLCDEGYTTDGQPGGHQTFRLECNHDSHWLEEPLRCEPVTCGAPKRHKHATINHQTAEAVFGIVLTYTCAKGYSTSTSDNPFERAAHQYTTKCRADGTYSKVDPCVNINDCLVHDCAKHGLGECVDNERPEGNPENDYHCKCDHGYEQHIDENREKHCYNINDCPLKNSFAHECGAFGTCNDLVLGYSCTCKKGYHVGALASHEGNVTCVPDVCGVPPTTDNAKLKIIPRSDAGDIISRTNVGATKGSDVLFRGKVEYTCDDGFTLSQTSKGQTTFTIECQAGGSFSARKDCHPVPCGAPPKVSNALYDSSDLFYATLKTNRSVTYTCFEGHTTSGDPDGASSFDVECLASGDTAGVKRCDPVKCPAVPRPQHARTSSRAAFVFADIVVFSCDEGYSTDQTTSGEAQTFSLECLASGVFSNTEKACKPIKCGEALTIPNATTEFTSNAVFGDRVDYKAVKGYTLNGRANGPTEFFITCQADGTFSKTSEEIPLKPVDCGVLPARPHTTREKDPKTYGQPSTYTCDAGYSTDEKAQGNGNVSFEEKCGAQGTFTDTNTCKPVRCGLPKAPTHSTRSEGAGDVVFPATVKFHCDAGYSTDAQVNGNQRMTVSCQADGTFTPSLTCHNMDDCVGHKCGKNGECVDKPNPTGVHFDDYTCNCKRGFELRAKEVKGVQYHICGSIPDCPANACLDGGSCEDLVQDYKCHCTSGYYEAANPAANLKHDCLRQNCGRTPKRDNAKASAPSSEDGYYGDKVTYTCARGFTTDGAPDGMDTYDVTCGHGSADAPEGTWTGLESQCTAVRCGEPAEVDHAKVAETGVRVFPDTVIYHCDSGYTLTGTTDGDTAFSARCTPSGGFSFKGNGAAPECKPVFCGRKTEDDIPHAVFSPIEMVFGDKQDVTCQTGYFSTTPHSVTFTLSCQNDGTFAPYPGCHPRECSEAPTVAGSTHTPNSRTIVFGESVTYTCNKGHTLSGHPNTQATFELACRASGTFGPTQECKKVMCGETPTFAHATAGRGPSTLLQRKQVLARTSVAYAFNHTMMAEPLRFEDTVSFTCDDGYSLTGQANSETQFVIHCQFDGSIEGGQECKPVSCGKPTKVPNARVFENVEMTFGDTVRYECLSGYSTTGKMIRADQDSDREFVRVCGADGTLSFRGGTTHNAADTKSDNGAGSVPCTPIAWCAEEGTDKCTANGSCHNKRLGYRCTCNKGYKVSSDESGKQICVEVNECEEDYGTHACAGSVGGARGTCVDEVDGHHCVCIEGYEQSDPAKGRVECHPKLCGMAPTVPFARTRRLKKVRYNDAPLLYVCQNGHSTDGTPTVGRNRFEVECMSNGEFSEKKECKPVKCGAPQSVDHATNPTGEFTFDQNAHYKCDKGYTISGNADGVVTFSVRCKSRGTFSAPERCLPVRCGDNPEVAFATYKKKNRHYQDTTKYTCGEGHTLNGKARGSKDFEVTCTADGTFRGVKQCLPVSCGVPPKVENAVHDKTNQFFGDVTQVSCDLGHTVDGAVSSESSFTMTCAADGTFSNADSGCKPVSCGAPKATSHADPVTSEARVYGQTGEWKCHEGFSTNGHIDGDLGFKEDCLADGNWGDASPWNCIDIDYCQNQPCGNKGKCFDCSLTTECASSLLETAHRFLDRGAPFGTNAKGQYACRCQEGYETTVEDGRLTCSEDDCGHSHCGVGGTCIDLSAQGEDGAYTCECLQGYQLHEHIQDDGSALRSCKRVACGDVPIKENAFYEFKSFTNEKVKSDTVPFVNAMDAVTYTCETGYSTDGSAAEGSLSWVTWCSVDGTFGNMQSCRRVKCDNYQPAALPNIMLTEPHAFFEYGDIIAFQCAPGHTLDGDPAGPIHFSIRCRATGLFEDVETCKPVSCGVAPRVAHASGQHHDADYHYGDQGIVYHCIEGHYVQGTRDQVQHVRCGESGYFVEDSGVDILPCEPRNCGPPPAVKNAVMVGIQAATGEDPLLALNRNLLRTRSAVQRATTISATRTVDDVRKDLEIALAHGGTALDFATFDIPSLRDLIKAWGAVLPTREEAEDEKAWYVRAVVEHIGTDGHISNLSKVSNEDVENLRNLYNLTHKDKIARAGDDPLTVAAYSVQYMQTVQYECRYGYSVDGSDEGQKRMYTVCKADGTFSPLSHCSEIMANIYGTLEDSENAGVFIQDVTITFENVNSLASYVFSADGTSFEARVPPGIYRVTASAPEYITNTIDAWHVSGNQGEGEGPALTLSKSLAADEWRVVLTWALWPSDLDLWVYVGNPTCAANSECSSTCHVSWMDPHLNYCAETGGTITTTLDRDAVSGFGPETVTVKGVGKCDPTTEGHACAIAFFINLYSTWEDTKMPGSHGEITFYNGDRIVKKLALKDLSTAADEWIPVATLDGATGTLVDGFHKPEVVASTEGGPQLDGKTGLLHQASDHVALHNELGTWENNVTYHEEKGNTTRLEKKEGASTVRSIRAHSYFSTEKIAL